MSEPEAKYRLIQGLARWVIVHPTDSDLGWSGMRWVPFGGDVQICNFSSEEEARQYAEEVVPKFSTLSKLIKFSR